MKADLHIHTTASDGTMSPQEVVCCAREVGLSHIAITDHDTVNGLLALREMGELEKKGLIIIPGIEFSADLPGYEVHILGYNFDYSHPALRERLREITADRDKRARQMVDKMTELGYHVAFDRVIELAKGADSIGRPHIARALIEKGYFKNYHEVFQCLLDKGKPAYIPHYRMSPDEIIQLVERIGGVPVLAHPGLIGNDDIVNMLIQKGVQGLEVYHPKHDIGDTSRYLRLARQYHLLISGGSDFHGISGRYPENLGVFTVSAELAVNICYNKMNYFT